ncbi:RNA polymerase subunit sigma [Clostridium sp.]|uniref:RNA polymerase subunit sigma n=1 Tax=Clostridium sp. TaxID=1506 RepID=UPI003996484D
MNNLVLRELTQKELIAVRVKAELELIKLREIEIEDMQLRIEEIELETSIQAQQYSDMPKGSSAIQKDNSKDMIYIDNLKLKIKKHQVANRRIENALKILKEEENIVLRMLVIDKKSITKVSEVLGRDRRTIGNLRDEALEKVYNFITRIENTQQMHNICTTNTQRLHT